MTSREEIIQQLQKEIGILRKTLLEKEEELNNLYTTVSSHSNLTPFNINH